MERKFTTTEVQQIKMMIEAGYKTSKICEMFKHLNCTKMDVSNIRTRRHYKDVIDLSVYNKKDAR